MFFRIKKKIETPADEKLEQIKNILFPPLETKQEIDKEGNPVKFHIDYSADSNLDAALIDLEEGYNDEASRKTIKSVSDRLFEIRKILEVQRDIDSKAKYILVEDLETKNIEKTQT